MAKPEGRKVLSEDERKVVFLALVAAQDAGRGALSRKEVAERFGISDREVRWIDREGLDSGWPRWARVRVSTHRLPAPGGKVGLCDISERRPCGTWRSPVPGQGAVAVLLLVDTAPAW